MMRDFKCVTMLQDNAKLTPNYPAHPGPPLAPKWPKMAPSWHQIGSKNQLKMGYPIEPGGQKWGTPSAPGTINSKKSIQKSNASKKRAALHRLPPFEPKKRPTWLQVGIPNRSKIDKKSMRKSIVFLMPLGVDLNTNFVDFCFQNEAKLGPKWDQKSM